MRITGGTLRGRTVPGKPRPATRPTASRVREALFSIVGQDLSGVTVLDAYGGTGLLSFEAASRGADLAWILEKDGAAVRQIRQAAETLGLADRVVVRRGSAPKDLPPGRYGLILLDPPYALDPTEVLRAVTPLATDLVILEHASSREAPIVEGLEGKTRRYGDTALTVYRVV